MTTVSTKEQLKKAIADGVSEMQIECELAMHVHNSRKFTLLSAASVTALVAALAATPFTGGASMAAAGVVITATGLEIALVLATMFLGVALIKCCWSGYDEVNFEFGQQPKAHLRRKPTK